MSEKLFYSMGEVSEMFDVKPSLLRHWESQFPVLRPKRNKKGNRLFTPQDVENLKLIYHLVKERGMTLEGANKSLKQLRAGSAGMERDVELLERLQRIRAMLAEVREELKAGEEEPLQPAEPQAEHASAGPEADDSVAEKELAETPLVRLRQKAVVRIVESGEPSPADGEKGARKPSRRRPRRRKEEVDEKELFAFYEQSLF